MSEDIPTGVINNNETSVFHRTESYDTELYEGTFMASKVKRMYHDQRLSQSHKAFQLSFLGSIAGFVVIVGSLIVGYIMNNIEWVGVAGGAITECVSVLFYALSNESNKKISEFFQELTKESYVKHSIDLANNIKNEKVRDDALVKLSLHLSGISDDKVCELTISKIDVEKDSS